MLPSEAAAVCEVRLCLWQPQYVRQQPCVPQPQCFLQVAVCKATRLCKAAIGVWVVAHLCGSRLCTADELATLAYPAAWLVL